MIFSGWVIGLLALIVIGGGERTAHGSEAVDYGGERYQAKLLEEAAAQSGLVFEPNPQGKVVERVVTVSNDVISPDEPYPKLLNWFHVTTLPRIIEREMLFKVGDEWNEDRVLETARNLRNYQFLSSARVVACRGSDPRKVVALVVTKDLWSLRPNANFLFVGSTLQSLQAELTEQNLAGRMKRATIDLGLDIATQYAGLQYSDPRLFGSELNLIDRADLIWNRNSGALEGGVFNFTLQQPLYTLDTEWGWTSNLSYRQDIYRLFASDQVAQFLSRTTGERIPYEIQRHSLDLQLGATRSFGRYQKTNVSFGYRAFVHQFTIPAPDHTVQNATVRDFDASVVPLTESVGLLYVGVRRYESNYRTLLDIQSFAVTEDYRLGLDLAFEARLANPAFGFSSTYFEPIFNASWGAYSADDLFTVSTTASSRYQPERGAASPWVNGVISAGVQNVSPRFSFLRLHAGIKAGRRFYDFNHNFTALGGDTGLRGYPTSYLLGANYWSSNAELRTQPISFWTLHVGLAAFYDMGAASDNIAQLAPHASAGGGLRIGLPQFNHEVIRIDFGVPLEQLSNADPAYIVAKYGQAF